MPWFRVDDGLAFHAKAVAAGNSAMGLWVRAGSWAAQQLNDGFIPDHIAAILGTPSQASKLCRVGLWHEVSGGFSFHEWDQRQPKKEVIEEERAAGRRRMQEFRAQKKGTKSATPVVSEPGTPEHLSTPSEVCGNPYPALPNPAQPLSIKSVSAKRGTRLAPDFIPAEQARATILAECPSVDLTREHAKFVDYWAAQPGAKGVKLDWDAVWRNWMRRAGETTNRPRGRQQETDDLFGRAMVRATVADMNPLTAIEGNAL